MRRKIPLCTVCQANASLVKKGKKKKKDKWDSEDEDESDGGPAFPAYIMKVRVHNPLVISAFLTQRPRPA